MPAHLQIFVARDGVAGGMVVPKYHSARACKECGAENDAAIHVGDFMLATNRSDVRTDDALIAIEKKHGQLLSLREADERV
jgi:hypothetical protein